MDGITQPATITSTKGPRIHPSFLKCLEWFSGLLALPLSLEVFVFGLFPCLSSTCTNEEIWLYEIDHIVLLETEKIHSERQRELLS